MDTAILTGQCTTHLVARGNFFLHRQALEPFQDLCAEAARAGFDLQVASGFRSHQQQLEIWNQKASGQRPLLDTAGQPLTFSALAPQELLASILRWSAIPGASRHHWGTELDVYDGCALALEEVALTPQEVAGPCASLHAWLDCNLARFDFFRPYCHDLGGVAPEMWHLSYAPVSQDYFERYDWAIFADVVDHPQLALGELITLEASAIFERYVRRISPRPDTL